MREAARTRSYAVALWSLVVTERLDRDWTSRAPKKPPDNFVHAEWIALRNTPSVRSFVDLLRAELDRVGPSRGSMSRLLPAGCRSRACLLRGRLYRADLRAQH